MRLFEVPGEHSTHILGRMLSVKRYIQTKASGIHASEFRMADESLYLRRQSALVSLKVDYV